MGALVDQKLCCDKFCHKGKDNLSFEMDFDQNTSLQLPLQLSAQRFWNTEEQKLEYIQRRLKFEILLQEC